MAEDYAALANTSCLDCLRLVRMLTAASIDIENQDTDLKAKRRRISDLEGRLHKQEEQVVVDEQIQRIFKLWCVIRSKAINRMKLDKKRRELISTLLNLGYEEQDFRQAFMGVDLLAEQHPSGHKYYTLNFVMRDAQNLERFRDAYLSEWKQWDRPFASWDMERLNRFANGEDPASEVQVPEPSNVVDIKQRKKAA